MIVLWPCPHPPCGCCCWSFFCVVLPAYGFRLGCWGIATLGLRHCLVYHFSSQNDIKPQKYHYFGLVSIERFRNFMLILERTLIILLCWDRCGVESKWYVAYNVLPMLPFPTTAVWTSVSERKKQPDFYLTFEVQVRSKQIFNHIYIWGSSFPLP